MFSAARQILLPLRRSVHLAQLHLSKVGLAPCSKYGQEVRPKFPRAGVTKPLRVYEISVRTSCRKGSLCCKAGLGGPFGTIKRFFSYLSPWNLLTKIGVSRCAVINFRRTLKYFHYPWIAYCIPAALTLGAGDYLAQNWSSEHTLCKAFDHYRFWLYVLIGFAWVAPIIWRWNLFLNRVLMNKSKAAFIATKITLNQIIISPILLGVLMSLVDFENLRRNWPELMPLWEKRYKEPFWEIMKLNFQTRPLMALFLCYMCPGPLRWYVRALYEIVFFAYVSDILARAHFGTPLVTTPRRKCTFHDKHCPR